MNKLNIIHEGAVTKTIKHYTEKPMLTRTLNLNLATQLTWYEVKLQRSHVILKVTNKSAGNRKYLLLTLPALTTKTKWVKGFLQWEVKSNGNWGAMENRALETR